MLKELATSAFGRPGGTRPQPPGIRTFIKKRTASIEAQLAGSSKGYVPQQFGFGPPPASGSNSQPIDEKSFRDAVQVPPEFEATLYAAPPKVHYPVAIAAAPAGERRGEGFGLRPWLSQSFNSMYHRKWELPWLSINRH